MVMEMENMAFSRDRKLVKRSIWTTGRAGNSKSIMKYEYKTAMVICKLLSNSANLESIWVTQKTAISKYFSLGYLKPKAMTCEMI